jgi:hypothetical protein
VGRGRAKGEGKGGLIWWMYFVFVDERRTMNLLKLF